MTGLLFGVIAIFWIAYLLPWFLSHRDQGPVISDDDVDQFVESMQLIRKSDESIAVNDNPDLVFSTPLMRDAMRAEVARASKTAASRRRIGLILHLILVVVGFIAPMVLPVSPWVAVVPVVLLCAFLLLCRLSVGVVGRRLDARMAIIQHGWDEETVALLPANAAEGSHELSIELSGPIGEGRPSLLAPLPVTPATYVSKPLVPRSVRTIDLGAPVASTGIPKVPVTANRPRGRKAAKTDRPRAVGE